jgi:hypothetical protein
MGFFQQLPIAKWFIYFEDLTWHMDVWILVFWACKGIYKVSWVGEIVVSHVCSVQQSFWSGPLLQAQKPAVTVKKKKWTQFPNMNPVNVPKTVRPNESYIVTIDSHNKERRKWRKEGPESRV